MNLYLLDSIFYVIQIYFYHLYNISSSFSIYVPFYFFRYLANVGKRFFDENELEDLEERAKKLDKMKYSSIRF